MILLANFLLAAARIAHLILMIYIWIVIFRAVFSWVQVPSLYQVSVILHSLTEPVLRPLRRFIPPYRLGGIDISPILAIFLIMFVDSFLVKSLTLYAQQLLRQNTIPF